MRAVQDVGRGLAGRGVAAGRLAGWGLAAAVAAGSMTATPAAAQFYLKSRDLSGAPVQGDEPGIAAPLPGATRAETRANLVWTLRAALNVAALQCDFQPSLGTNANYNALLRDHKAELAASWDTLGKYFTRTNGKSKAAGGAALEHYQTQTWSSFSTVAAQITFCQTAGTIGRDALFAPRGELATIAEQRMRELRNSLTPYGEQTLFRFLYAGAPVLPRFDPVCWNKKGEWVTKKCGAQNWPAAGTGIASR